MTAIFAQNMATRPAFADTSYYQALLHRRDALHEKAWALAHDLESRLITSDYVLLELGGLMASVTARPHLVPFIEKLRNDPDTTIVPANPQLLDSGLNLFASRPDKDWSLTDCISFVIMKQHQLTEALSADHHFEQAGFRALLISR